MKLKLGLPKGSLQEATFALFGRAGFNIKVASRSYQPVIDDPEIEPILIRPQEIPMYLDQGIIDAGLTGHDWIENWGIPVHEVCELKYSKATNNPIRIVLAVQNGKDEHGKEFNDVKDLQGHRIATEYVALTRRWLAEQNVEAEVDFSWGACEVKVPSLVPAIVVNTETGNSLRAHNLKEIATLLVSTTRFVASEAAMADRWKNEKIDSLRILLEGAMNAASLVGLKMNLPVAKQEEILQILPSLKNPTLSPLADPSWIAAEVILNEREVRDLIPQLKRAGAEGLVEYPLNKVIH